MDLVYTYIVIKILMLVTSRHLDKLLMITSFWSVLDGDAILRWHRAQKYRHFIVDECPSPVLDNGRFRYIYRSILYIRSI